MSNTATKAPGFLKHRNKVLKQIHKMRAELEDLNDYLDLLEARAQNQGKPTYSMEQVKEKIGLR